jgi:Undecaprenyl-phosphate galactose phosphotransferase WbaP
VPGWSRVVLSALPLLIADLIALGVVLAFGHMLIDAVWMDVTAGAQWAVVLTGLALPLTFLVFGLYPGTGLNVVSELAQVSVATVLLCTIFLISARLAGVAPPVLLLVFIASVALAGFVSLSRAIARTLASRYGWWGEPVLVFGNGKTAHELYDHYCANPALGMRPIAIAGEREAGSDAQGNGQGSAPWDRVERLRREHRISWAVVTTPLSASSAASVRSYLARFPHVLIVPEAEGLPSIRHQMFDCANLPGIPMTNLLLLAGPRIIKKLMDYVLVIVGGLLCLPLIAIISLLIKTTSPGPVFYAQRRIGRAQRTFRAWKFRTMVEDADQVLEQCLADNPALREEWERDHKLKNDPRITSVGRWLRKTSLDELPQVWNVLRGEMSLVGPRPIVAAEVPKYGEWFELYEKVTPGITGLWQISGRNNTTYERRVAFDSYYVLNWSPWLDQYILARTVNVVFRHDGAY